MKIGHERQPHAQDAPQVDAVRPALPVAEMNRDVAPAQRAVALEREGERDVLHVEVGRNESERLLQRPGADEAIGHIRVLKIEAGERRGNHAAHAGDEHAQEAVVARLAHAEDHVGIGAALPELGEVGRIALAVGVDLQRPRRAARDGPLVAGAAGLAVTGVGLVDRLDAARLRLGQKPQRRRGAVARAVVDWEDDLGDAELAEGRSPLADDLGDVGLLVVNGHDDGELRLGLDFRHARWSGRGGCLSIRDAPP